MSIQATTTTQAPLIVRKNRMGKLVFSADKLYMEALRMTEDDVKYSVFVPLALGVSGVVGDDYLGIEVNGKIVSIRTEM